MAQTDEEMERRIAELKAEVAKIKRERQQIKRERERARKYNVLLQEAAPSSFLDYLQGVENHIFTALRLPPTVTSASYSTFGMTHVDANFYPRRLRPWTTFEDVHASKFRALVADFGDSAVFPSLTDVRCVGRDLSPSPRTEIDLRPFLRAAVEKPAVRILSAHIDFTGRPRISDINFRLDAYSLRLATDTDEGAEEISLAHKYHCVGIPHRWLVGDQPDGSCSHFLVGEYKALYKLTAEKLSSVLSTNPGEDFFAQAIKKKDLETRLAEANGDSQAANGTPRAEPSDVYIARVLCQAYHHMITSGLEYGYVTSGVGLVFLRVREDDPQTLYYFWSAFPATSLRSEVVRDTNEEAIEDSIDEAGDEAMVESIEEADDEASPGPVNTTGREPHKTAAAYLTTLCMLAMASTARPRSWIDARERDLARWPEPYDETVPQSQPVLSSLADLGIHGSGAYNDCSQTAGIPIRPRSDSQTMHSAPQTLQTLPYCTQACLNGLCLGAPLDDRCPNVELHRAAWLSSSASHSSNLPKTDQHPLTTTALCARIVNQLAQDMDSDCECLDIYGCFGQYGVLFKIAVTGYGYTLVAKGVQAMHRHILVREATVYNALAAVPGPPLQGRLVPVFLGIADLERPLPLISCARVPHLMLMSYAGPSLATSSTRLAMEATGVDCEAEKNRTTVELNMAGLYNEDERLANMAWNAEARRVMELDFDQACMMPVWRKTPPPSTPSPTSYVPLSLESPVLGKQDMTHARDDSTGELPQPLKRLRTDDDIKPV